MLPMTSPLAHSSGSPPPDNRKGITRLTVNIPEANLDGRVSTGAVAKGTPADGEASTRGRAITKQAGKLPEESRWRTKEFRFYGFCFAVVVPFMIWWPIRLSSSSHPNYLRFQHKLSPGWIPGREIDISDPQYRTFRQNIPSLLLLSGAYLLCSQVHRWWMEGKGLEREGNAGQGDGRKRGRERARFIAGFAVGMLVVLHGVNASKILFIIYLNHGMLRFLTPRHTSSATSQTPTNRRNGTPPVGTPDAGTGFLDRLRGKKWIMPLGVWSLNCGVLWLNDWFDGYPFRRLGVGLDALDSYTGLLPRWHVLFNVTMLRLISFGMDYNTALTSSRPNLASQYDASGRALLQVDGDRVSNGDGAAIELDHTRSRETSPTRGVSLMPAPPAGYKARVRTSLPLEDYTLTNLMAYALYPPLYNAGPIMTFNDFVWQLRHPVIISPKSTFRYAIRFLASLLTMELVLHYMYVVAIKDTNAWEGDSPADLSLIGLWNLMVVWLKLLLPWRFFRLWALMDGMDPPENMVRCVLNNYSTMGFWKSWHRSYNLWVVRYVYIPIGGDQNVVPATLLVFTFVALWHDLSLRLLAWGWLVSLFVIPELVAKALVPTDKYSPKWWYRHACAVGAVFNIVMMMSANLVGFVIGLDGVKYLMKQLISSRQGLYFSAFAFVCLFIHSQVMMEYRATELRQGISRKC